MRGRACEIEFRDVLLGAAAIVSLALLLGLLTNHVAAKGVPLFASDRDLRPPVPEGVSYLSLAEASGFLGQPGVLFLDGRPPEAFQEGHLPGAVNLPVDEVGRYHGALEQRMRAAALLICYCDALNCDEGSRLTRQVVALGYPNVALMFEGWEGWQRAELPGEVPTGGGR